MEPRKTKKLLEILRWADRMYHPNLFISIQIPFEAKTEDMDAFMRQAWLIIKRAEKNLLGRYWVSKHYRFVGFCERGQDKTWHAHLLLACHDRDKATVEAAFAAAGEYYKRTRRTEAVPDILIKEITGLKGVIRYCTKQLGLDRLAHVRSEHIFLSEEIFNHGSSRFQACCTNLSINNQARNTICH